MDSDFGSRQPCPALVHSSVYLKSQSSPKQQATVPQSSPKSNKNGPKLWATGFPGAQTPLRIQKVDPPYGSIIYTIGVLKSRIGGSTCWILPEVWVGPFNQANNADSNRPQQAPISPNRLQTPNYGLRFPGRTCQPSSPKAAHIQMSKGSPCS